MEQGQGELQEQQLVRRRLSLRLGPRRCATDPVCRGNLSRPQHESNRLLQQTGGEQDVRSMAVGSVVMLMLTKQQECE